MFYRNHSTLRILYAFLNEHFGMVNLKKKKICIWFVWFLMDKHFSEANLLFSLLPYQRRGKKKEKHFFLFFCGLFFFLFSLWKKIFKKKKEYKTKLLWYVGHDSVNAKREKLVIPGTHTISAAFLWALFLFFFFLFPIFVVCFSVWEPTLNHFNIYEWF